MRNSKGEIVRYLADAQAELLRRAKDGPKKKEDKIGGIRNRQHPSADSDLRGCGYLAVGKMLRFFSNLSEQISVRGDQITLLADDYANKALKLWLARCDATSAIRFEVSRAARHGIPHGLRVAYKRYRHRNQLRSKVMQPLHMLSSHPRILTGAAEERRPPKTRADVYRLRGCDDLARVTAKFCKQPRCPLRQT